MGAGKLRQVHPTFMPFRNSHFIGTNPLNPALQRTNLNMSARTLDWMSLEMAGLKRKTSLMHCDISLSWNLFLPCISKIPPTIWVMVVPLRMQERERGSPGLFIQFKLCEHTLWWGKCKKIRNQTSKGKENTALVEWLSLWKHAGMLKSWAPPSYSNNLA